ncbi:uncharacterized protein LOC5504792 isoform X2 [Nematostella vectensis]|uniref:uncharacterized protein LOC5504792 isoform X2 n=1 Tax=Nematostella vectensis TaxID=45351 RepID=UPI002076E2CE|nr:uncharacterized protein LOC5504792 isoform X2 [Nematostella vectensis]
MASSPLADRASRVSGRRSIAREERSPTSYKPARDRAKRSQALIEEQVLLVRDTQEALKKALETLETDATGDHERSEEQLQSLLNKSKELIVMVQVLMKIRNELAYARLDLEKAVKYEIGIEPAKKRVKWLQQRLEKVLSSARLFCQSANLQSSRSQRQTKSKFSRDQASDQLLDRLSESQHQRLFITETPDRFGNQRDVDVINDFNRMVLESLSQESIEFNKTPISQPDASMHKTREKIAGSPTSQKMTDKHKGKKKTKRRSDPAPVSSPSLAGLKQIPAPQEDLYDGGGDTTPEPLSDAEDDHRETASVISSVQLDEGLGLTTASVTSSTDSQTDQTTMTTPRKILEWERENQDRTHDREAKGSPGGVRQQATGSSDKEEDLQMDTHGGEEEEDYWEMDHHRFQWSEYMQNLDPRSWHALGLAMQDTFLVKERPPFQSDLPWREKPMKVNSVIDVHKIALDKLLVRLHRMYDMIGQATQFTVDPLPQDEKLEVTMGRHDGSGPPSDGKILTGYLTALDSKPVSRDQPLPPIPSTANQKNMSLIERYPLTTNASMTRIARKCSDKMYPRNSGNWCEDVSAGRDIPRIVTSKPILLKRTSNIQPRYLGKKTPLPSPTWTERNENVWKPVMVKRIIGAMKMMESERSREKLQSGYVDEDGPKWRRIQVLLGEEGLLSANPTIVMEAAKCLGLLQCRHPDILTALQDSLTSNTDARVCYEASKSLILLGTWSPHAMRVVMENIRKGNRDVVSELLLTMTKARNIPFVDKHTPEFEAMVSLLVYLIRHKPFEMAFNAAISLGRLCVVEPHAKAFLIKKLPTLLPQEKSEALYVLIKQFNCKDHVVLDALLQQMSSSYNWKHRLEAAELLIFIGSRDVFKVMSEDEVFDVLEKLLWDHANKELRLKISEALAAMGLRQRACALALRRLEDPKEEVRGRAVISLATLGMKGTKEMKALLDLLELDTSVYVRIQVVRAFSHLGWNDPRIIRSLRERERGEGTLAM